MAMNEHTPESELTEQVATTIAVVLFEYGPLFSKEPDLARKGAISANFLARSARQLKSIRLLAQNDHVACGWQLYRSLLERFLLYWHLCQHDEFAVFDDWCFKKYYEFENRLRSSADLKAKPEVQQRDFVQRGKERYERVSEDEAVRAWRRPDPKGVTKALDMKFLYDVGYDHASGFVHPMSVDGYNDYLRLVAKTDMVQDEGSATLLRYSHLVATIHLREFLNQPEFIWRKELHDLVDAIRAAILDGRADVTTPFFQKVLLLNSQQHPLGKRAEGAD